MINWKTIGHEQISYYLDNDGDILFIASDRLLQSKLFNSMRSEPYDVTSNRLALSWIASSDKSLSSIDRIDYSYIRSHPIAVFELFNDYFILDGHHRYIKSHMLRLKSIPARYISRRVWIPYVIETDDEFLSKHPGLPGRKFSTG